jgi:hypothetical protein
MQLANAGITSQLCLDTQLRMESLLTEISVRFLIGSFSGFRVLADFRSLETENRSPDCSGGQRNGAA